MKSTARLLAFALMAVAFAIALGVAASDSGSDADDAEPVILLGAAASGDITGDVTQDIVIPRGSTMKILGDVNIARGIMITVEKGGNLEIESGIPLTVTGGEGSGFLFKAGSMVTNPLSGELTEIEEDTTFYVNGTISFTFSYGYAIKLVAIKLDASAKKDTVVISNDYKVVFSGDSAVNLDVKITLDTDLQTILADLMAGKLDTVRLNGTGTFNAEYAPTTVYKSGEEIFFVDGKSQNSFSFTTPAVNGTDKVIVDLEGKTDMIVISQDIKAAVVSDCDIQFGLTGIPATFTDISSLKDVIPFVTGTTNETIVFTSEKDDIKMDNVKVTLNQEYTEDKWTNSLTAVADYVKYPYHGSDIIIEKLNGSSFQDTSPGNLYNLFSLGKIIGFAEYKSTFDESKAKDYLNQFLQDLMKEILGTDLTDDDKERISEYIDGMKTKRVNSLGAVCGYIIEELDEDEVIQLILTTRSTERTSFTADKMNVYQTTDSEEVSLEAEKLSIKSESTFDKVPTSAQDCSVKDMTVTSKSIGSTTSMVYTFKNFTAFGSIQNNDSKYTIKGDAGVNTYEKGSKTMSADFNSINAVLSLKYNDLKDVIDSLDFNLKVDNYGTILDFGKVNYDKSKNTIGTSTVKVSGASSNPDSRVVSVNGSLKDVFIDIAKGQESILNSLTASGWDLTYKQNDGATYTEKVSISNGKKTSTVSADGVFYIGNIDTDVLDAILSMADYNVTSEDVTVSGSGKIVRSAIVLDNDHKQNGTQYTTYIYTNGEALSLYVDFEGAFLGVAGDGKLTIVAQPGFTLNPKTYDGFEAASDGTVTLDSSIVSLGYGSISATSDPMIFKLTLDGKTSNVRYLATVTETVPDTTLWVIDSDGNKYGSVEGRTWTYQYDIVGDLTVTTKTGTKVYVTDNKVVDSNSDAFFFDVPAGSKNISVETPSGAIFSTSSSTASESTVKVTVEKTTYEGKTAYDIDANDDLTAKFPVKYKTATVSHIVNGSPVPMLTSTETIDGQLYVTVFCTSYSLYVVDDSGSDDMMMYIIIGIVVLIALIVIVALVLRKRKKH